MLSTKMVTFCKHTNCPSSQDLLAFQHEELSNETGELVKKHIETCEFCEAEVEFYTHYPQAEEKVKREAIPLPLYELAESLLSKKDKNCSALNNLLLKEKAHGLRKAEA